MTDTNQKLREALQAISHIDDATNHSADASAALDRIGQIARQALALPTADHLPEVLARDIYQGLGYAKWENFSSLIKRCKQLIAHGQYAGLIEETERSVEIGSGAIRQVIDYKLDANAHQLVTSMASAFKLIGHYPSRNETSILSLIERWCKEKKISFVPQAKAIRGHVYDALVGDCVAVEFDEPHHIGSRQKTRDAKKDSESISSGIRVLRIGIDANIIDAIVSLESMLSKKMIETAAPVGERAEFEKWAREHFYSGLACPSDSWSDERKTYNDPAHHMAFCAFRAALSAGDAVDAARYRWLADCLNYYEAIALISDGSLTAESLGKAIDAAMRKGKP